MRSSRQITSIAALFLLGISAVLPGSSWANSLLSGYGGPGQGSQAILGSALLNGPSGGSGGGGGGGTSSGGSSSSTVSPTTSTTSGGEGTTSSGAGGRAPRQGTRRSSSSGARVGPTGKGHHPPGVSTASTSRKANPYALVEAAYGTHAGGSETLGLSGADLLYLLVGLIVLLVTGILTLGLARRPSVVPTAKGITRQIRVTE